MSLVGGYVVASVDTSVGTPVVLSIDASVGESVETLAGVVLSTLSGLVVGLDPSELLLASSAEAQEKNSDYYKMIEVSLKNAV